MKLSEFCVLSEIERIPVMQDHGANVSKAINIEIIKKKYLNDFYIERGRVNDQWVLFVRKLDGDRTDEHELVAFLVYQDIDDFKPKNGHKLIMVVRTWCESDFRNKGIITNLYRFLYNELQFAVLSDVHQTPETISIWNKVREYWPVKMIDINTHEIKEIDDKKLYDPELDYVLILERKRELPLTNPFYKITIVGGNNSILEDYLFNSDGL